MDQQQGMNKTYMIVGGVIVLILVIWGIYALNHQNSDVAVNNTNQPTSQDNSANTVVPDSTATSGVGTNPSGAATKSYQAALLKYAKSRIQFTGCQATPSNLVLKNPATIMLDNRSNAVNKIVIDAKTYNLAAYGYQIVTLNESVLTAHSYIDCNGSQNVASWL